MTVCFFVHSLLKVILSVRFLNSTQARLNLLQSAVVQFSTGIYTGSVRDEVNLSANNMSTTNLIGVSPVSSSPSLHRHEFVHSASTDSLPTLGINRCFKQKPIELLQLSLKDRVKQRLSSMSSILSSTASTSMDDITSELQESFLEVRRKVSFIRGFFPAHLFLTYDPLLTAFDDLFRNYNLRQLTVYKIFTKFFFLNYFSLSGMEIYRQQKTY